MKASGVDKLSVSINAGDKETYNEICRPIFADAYEATIDFINKVKSMLEIEVTAVRMPEVDLAKAQAAADWLGVNLRVREYILCFFLMQKIVKSNCDLNS